MSSYWPAIERFGLMNLKYSRSWNRSLAVDIHFLIAFFTTFNSFVLVPDMTIEHPSSGLHPSRHSKLVIYCLVCVVFYSFDLSCSILNRPQPPTLKFLEMKFELGHIIVWVSLAIIDNIFGDVFVATVRLSLYKISSINLDASFSTKITSGFTWDIFYLIICTNDAS